MTTFEIFRGLFNQARKGKAIKNLAHFIVSGSNDPARYLRLTMEYADRLSGQDQVHIDWTIEEVKKLLEGPVLASQFDYARKASISNKKGKV